MAVTAPAGFDLNIEGSSAVTVQSGAALNVSSLRLSSGTMTTYIDLAFVAGGDFELSSAGRLNVMGGAMLDLEYFDATNVRNGTIDLRAGGTLAVQTGAVTVGSGVALIKDGSFGVTNEIASLTVLSGGIVTHSLRLEAGLVLNVTSILDVQSGGLIDVNAKGLRGGSSGSAFGIRGETYSSAGVIVAGAGGTAAASSGSYGGRGVAGSASAASAPYGLQEDPGQLGSGGGGGSDLNGTRNVGGHGGGRVTIVAGSVAVNGVIRANGGAGSETYFREGKRWRWFRWGDPHHRREYIGNWCDRSPWRRWTRYHLSGRRWWQDRTVHGLFGFAVGKPAGP